MKSLLTLIVFMAAMYGIWSDNTSFIGGVLIFGAGYFIGGLLEFLEPTKRYWRAP
jgi:hypothetical protein